jgi:hypothetical protein
VATVAAVRVRAVLLAALVAVVVVSACGGDPESQASGPDGETASGNGEPDAPDVDPCQLPGSVIAIHSGLSVGDGEYTGTGDAEATCVYADSGGNRMIITVDTSDGSGRYDEAQRTTGGREDIDSVGDEAFWRDPQLTVLGSGHYWTFELQSAAADDLRRQNVAIAVAQQMDL